ncbi:sulfonate transport system substrate-binding protein [Rhodoferax ferrireducens]|uniref:Sulfonate transport system substrate-binding protein n=1 Tax=Rhodoferax ferrireducens TaxID=192843 RepID=A0ABU2C4X4_9BURK|nr:ABC transporter substrate-binding protein [Rhodoferax ferrireducens]MDR7376383.1 sulfonate transport system substrate-binding protein [Rhodoferax ferrireducens]
MQRRTFQQFLSAVAFLSPALGHTQTRAVVRAGDQKGGLRALLEAAGELKGLPYDIQWTEFPAAAPLAEALNADAVDFGPIGDAPLLFSLAAGSRVKAFAVNRSDPYGTAILVAPNSPLKDASSLKGKSVATNRGSIGHFVTLKALASVGLKAEDISLRFLAPPDAKLALTQGSVDAWATWEPYTALAETGGHARVLVNGRNLWSGLSFLAATDNALRDKRNQLQDLQQRIVRAQAWATQHPAEFSATLARIIGIPAEAARLQFERRQTRWQSIDTQVVADQQRTADFYLDAGLIKQKLDVRATFDTGLPLAA